MVDCTIWKGGKSLGILPLKGVSAGGLTIWKTITSSLQTLSFEWKVRRVHCTICKGGVGTTSGGRSRAVPREGGLESSVETEALKRGCRQLHF